MITTQMIKRRAFLQGTAAVGALAIAGIPRSVFAETYNVKLNIMSHPGQILPIYTHHTEYLKKTFGIEMNLLESPDPTSYQDTLKDLQSGGGRYDMVMQFPRFNGDLASSGALMPLNGLIEKFGAQDLYAGISDDRKLYCEWGGNIVAVPVDGDVAMMYYRKDAFESEAAKQLCPKGF